MQTMSRLEKWFTGKLRSHHLSKSVKPQVVSGIFILIAAVVAGVFQAISAEIQHRKSGQKPLTTLNIQGNKPIVSVNQQGGVTAERVIVNQGIPKPEFSLKEIITGKEEGGLYKAEYELEVKTVIPIPRLRLEARSPSIVGMEVVPQRVGVMMAGHSGVRTGYAFDTLYDVYGTYRIVCLTKEKEPVPVVNFSTDLR